MIYGSIVVACKGAWYIVGVVVPSLPAAILQGEELGDRVTTHIANICGPAMLWSSRWAAPSGAGTIGHGWARAPPL